LAYLKCSYTIPTDDGDLTPGKRLHNWAWYSNLAADSPEMKDLFTDISGKEHFGTVPRGLVKPEAWEAKKALATSLLDKGHAEIVKRTTSPFITKVFDVSSPQALFMGGKVFLVGDAQITIRPNVGLGSTHAAHDCNTLERFIEKEITAEQWEKAVLRYGAVQSRFAFAVSAYGLGNKPALLWYAGYWLLLMLAQKIGLA
jgi:2-polyprenyl-6-methoxyphenol hydroxylase-like FAD-dependent oxidoreductase